VLSPRLIQTMALPRAVAAGGKGLLRSKTLPSAKNTSHLMYVPPLLQGSGGTSVTAKGVCSVAGAGLADR